MVHRERAAGRELVLLGWGAVGDPEYKGDSSVPPLSKSFLTALLGLSLVRVRFGSHLGPLWLWQSLLANGRALYFAIYCGQAVQPLVLLTSLRGDEYSGFLESRPDSTSTLISGDARLPGS